MKSYPSLISFPSAAQISRPVAHCVRSTANIATSLAELPKSSRRSVLARLRPCMLVTALRR